MEKFKVQAPTRADLSGGTLDLWPVHSILRGTKTINVALDLFSTAYFEVKTSKGLSVHLIANDGAEHKFSEPMSVNDLKRLAPSLKFPCFVVSEFIRINQNFPYRAIKIRLDTQAPVGSGLGGSSVLCVILARGMSRIHGSFTELGWQWEMLDWVRDVEAAYLKVPTGTQDYLGALFGGLKCYEYSFGDLNHLKYKDSAFTELSDRALILFSGEMHDSGMSNWEVYKRLIEGDKNTMKGFLAIRDLTEDIHDELSSQKPDWIKIGAYFTQEWKVRASLFKVGTPRLKKVMDFLKKQKVLGAKVCGAAQGGSLLALAHPDKIPALKKACEEQGIQVLATKPTLAAAEIIEDSPFG